MSNIELRFERPWLFLLLIPAVLLILLPWLRMPKRRRNTLRRITPVVIHGIMAILLVILLTGFTVVRTTQNQAIIILVDHSESTAAVRDALDQRATELQKLLKKDAAVKTVVFGGDCAENLKADLQITDATDLSAALDYAAAMLPDDKVGRIVVLSDGRQTDGDAAATAQYLHSQGVRIDTVWVDTTSSGREAQIGAFTGPQTAFEGNTVTLNAVIESNSKTTMTLTVHDGQEEVYNRQMTVDDSGTVLAIEVPAGAPGVHNYRLTMKADQDVMAQNNVAVAFVEVLEKPHVLLLTGLNTDSTKLQKELESKARITVCSVKQPPRKITELCNYDGVILMNVHADDLPKNYGNLLSRYVSEYGRSLIALGGTETFMYGAMRNTQYEKMMPVDFSLSRTSDDAAVALMLVVDCSLSMSQQSTYMSVAKQGSIKCVESMTENDYVGLISFNQEAKVESALAKNTRENKDHLNRIISSLFTDKGTYYTDALSLAHQELLKSDAEIRHILFVSDGGPADSGYTELFPQIAADGITVSTIALGHESTVLSDMADSCGGTYYYVQEATELPNMMLSLTQHVTVNSLMTGSFEPQAVSGSGMPQNLPALSGYLGMTLKRGADAHILVEDGNPLLSSHTWGKGTVACFASDLNERWSSSWLRQPGLIGQVLGQFLPKEHQDSSMTVEYKAGVRSVELTVKTADTESYLLSVESRDFAAQLSCVAPGLYKTTLPVNGIGGYDVTVTQTDLKGETLDSWSGVAAVSVNKEYDAFVDSGLDLMKSVSLYGGGILTSGNQALAEVTAEPISTVKDFQLPFGIIFAVLFLIDTGIRKLRWKDFKNLWLTITRK